MPSEGKQFADFLKQIMNEPVWRDDALLKLFIYCISHASHNTYSWRGLQINPGDIPMSERHVSEELNWSRNKLDRKLKQLSEIGLIQVFCFPQKGTMVHVDRFFQNETSSTETGFPANPVGTQNEASFEKAPSRNWLHSEGSLLETGFMAEPNPYIRNNKLYTTHSLPDEPDGFNRLWLAYPAPRRTCKDEAAALFRKAISEGATVEAMLSALEAEKSSCAWSKESGRYIPGIVKWLQKETWHDYMVTEPVKEGKKWTSR